MTGLVGRVGDYFWNYVSPNKDQAIHADDRSSKTSPRAKQSRKRKSRGDNAFTDLDGDTLVEQEDAASATGLPKTDDFDVGDSTLVMTEHDYANESVEQKEAWDPEAEHKRLERIGEDLRNKSWAEDAISLYVRLEGRGKSAIVPSSWELEFGTLPTGLYDRGSNRAYLSSLTEAGDFRASMAFKELIELAARVRDADSMTRHSPTHSARSPETITKKAIAKHLKWAYADAKIRIATPKSRKSLDTSLLAGKMLPLIINEAGPRSMSAAELQASALDKLVKLGEQWKGTLFDKGTDRYVTVLPTLYAVISTHTVVGIVAYDIDFVNDDGQAAEPFLRTVNILDFSQKGHDVWNGIAVAILGAHIRGELVSLKSDMRDIIGEEQVSDADGDDVDL